MFVPRAKKLRACLRRRVPLVTLLLVGGALAAALGPGGSALLIYDRQAILSGEIWRLFTGHWVHFSMSHLVYDSLALGLAGWMIEARRVRCFGVLCLLAPWIIGLALLVACPNLRYYGGLSGLATCTLVYLALDGLGDRSVWCGVCMLLLAGVAAKIFFEARTGTMLFATIKSGTVEVATASHVAGALTALIFHASHRLYFGSASGPATETPKTSATERSRVSEGELSTLSCRVAASR